ncbi:hypothetical protein [Streptomyces sp. RLA2-12]|uniref:hypothetical protein n=1 Tax=Streptomyces sp. RLA2-12 TaxID=2721242 RepID=UPI00145CCA95|nr:hypothetical protein [Streptomyces sp. RLA2-12]NMI63166.1 hypothetical protein [Streptomyces sp. RLA2-12]
MATTPQNTPRYRVIKLRGGWAVKDTREGAIWTGLAHAGAILLSDSLNRRPR